MSTSSERRLTSALSRAVALIGESDEEQQIKPGTCVATKPGVKGTPEPAEKLKAHVESRLAVYK